LNLKKKLKSKRGTSANNFRSKTKQNETKHHEDMDKKAGDVKDGMRQ
jgi:hypothetical protein